MIFFGKIKDHHFDASGTLAEKPLIPLAGTEHTGTYVRLTIVIFSH